MEQKTIAGVSLGVMSGKWPGQAPQNKGSHLATSLTVLHIMKKFSVKLTKVSISTVEEHKLLRAYRYNMLMIPH